MQSHLKHREPARHFQDGCSPLTHVGFLVVVTHPLSFFRLCCCQVNAAGLCHDRGLLREVGFLLEYHDRINLFMFIIGGNTHQPKKSPSTSVGARAVGNGGVGLYGRPHPIPLAHILVEDGPIPTHGRP